MPLPSLPHDLLQWEGNYPIHTACPSLSFLMLDLSSLPFQSSLATFWCCPFLVSFCFAITFCNTLFWILRDSWLQCPNASSSLQSVALSLQPSKQRSVLRGYLTILIHMVTEHKLSFTLLPRKQNQDIKYHFYVES